MKRQDAGLRAEDPHARHYEKGLASVVLRCAFLSRGKVVLLAAVLVSALSALATLNTRTDIDPSKFPAQWDTANRMTYQVDVASAMFATLETAAVLVVAQTFDLNSYGFGLAVRFR